MHFYLDSRHLPEEEIYSTFIDKNDNYFTGSRIVCPTKICFIRYYRHFCGKLKEKLFLEKHRLWGPILLNFFSLPT